MAFVGGLDLTGGRYDTPDHELFKTLLVEHGNDDYMGNDFRNSNAKFLSPTQGPREPWHDIHSKVEGQIAYDVFLNFKERWERQGTSYGNLIPIEHTSVDVNAPLAIDPQKAWNVQFFRSITSDSAVFDPSLMSHVRFCTYYLYSQLFPMRIFAYKMSNPKGTISPFTNRCLDYSVVKSSFLKS